MTNLEAIEELKQIPIAKEASVERMKHVYEAVDIAIKALDITNEPKYHHNNKSHQNVMLEIEMDEALSVLVNKYLNHIPTPHMISLLEDVVKNLYTVAELQREF